MGQGGGLVLVLLARRSSRDCVEQTGRTPARTSTRPPHPLHPTPCPYRTLGRKHLNGYDYPIRSSTFIRVDEKICRQTGVRSSILSFNSFYASDIYGSELLWRKFTNAASFYGVEVLIMGGDIAGKAVVPIVRRNTSFYAPAVTGEQAFTEDQLPALERRIRDLGQYPYHMTEDELAAVQNDQSAIDALFLQIMMETLERWLRLAEERLRGKGVRLYVMLGNDDEPALREVLARSSIAVDPEDHVVELGEGFQMISCGFANPTPWHSPREMPEEELQRHLEKLAGQLGETARAVFYLQFSPIPTPNRTSPSVRGNPKPVIHGWSSPLRPVASQTARA